MNVNDENKFPDWLCENCNPPIPETKRMDAIFCSSKCGWRYRNFENQKKRAEQKRDLNSDPLEENYGIINDLYLRNCNVILR